MGNRRPVEGRAFTLVELMIVVAVIGVLAMLLMPALQAAIDSARTTACASRLKQIGLYSLLYSNDTGGWLPSLTLQDIPNPPPPPWWHPQLSHWMMWLYPYLNNKRQPWFPPAKEMLFFRCPSRARETTWFKNHAAVYGLNPNIGQKGIQSWVDKFYHDYAFNRVQEVGRPSGTHLCSDNGKTDDTGIALDRFGWWAPTSYNKQGPYRHAKRSGGNVVHIDGHVKFKRYFELNWPQSAGASAAMESAQKRLFHPQQAP